MEEHNRPKPPLTGIVYGEIVYWGTLLASLVGIVASVITFVTKSNLISPAVVLTGIWQNKSPDAIWQGAVGWVPNNHWYLNYLGTGDGLTAFSMSMGVFVVIPAMIGAAFLFFKDKSPVFGCLAALSAIITILAMF